MIAPETILALDHVAQQRELCDHLFLKSPHLRERALQLASEMLREQLESPIQFDPRSVEVEVDDQTLDRLFSVVSQQWTVCGENRPHHSVLSSDEYLPQNLNESAIQSMYQSGADELALIKRLSERAGVDLSNKRRWLELGCGVGRVTVHLAKEFENVTAVDVSPGNLRHCIAMMTHLGIKNADLIQIRHVRDIENLGTFDGFFSRIVLQHNPPPVQRFILDRILRSITHGGVACFQTVVGGKGYAYSAQLHLRGALSDDFEMHALPMRHIFEILSRLGFRVLDVFRELSGGYNVASYTFFAQRDTTQQR